MNKGEVTKDEADHTFVAANVRMETAPKFVRKSPGIFTLVTQQIQEDEDEDVMPAMMSDGGGNERNGLYITDKFLWASTHTVYCLLIFFVLFCLSRTAAIWRRIGTEGRKRWK